MGEKLLSALVLNYHSRARDKQTMGNRINILVQTTIPAITDDWNIDRFSLLRDHLVSLTDESGEPLYNVTARNREVNVDGNDAVLSVLDTTDFDELWLFAVDSGNGLTVADCQGVTRFRQRGGGILTMRAHQDLGSSLCTLGGVDRAHFFHSKHPEPDESRHTRDDQDAQTISWPNYHSGSNGDYQRISAVKPVHELLLNPKNDSGVVEYFPAHPHEGAVGVPEGENHANVIATGGEAARLRRGSVHGCRGLSGRALRRLGQHQPLQNLAIIKLPNTQTRRSHDDAADQLRKRCQDDVPTSRPGVDAVRVRPLVV